MADIGLEKDLQGRLGDAKWRLNNLYKIEDEDGRVVTFKMREGQERFYDEMHLRNIVLKSRQYGFTTLIELMGLDRCLFNSHTRAGIVAHTKKDAAEIFRTKIRFPYDNLPNELKAAIPAVQDSADQLSFGNGSSIRVSNSHRSGTLQFLHISEHGKICAHYPEKAKEVRTGALNTVHPGQFAFIESTAEGQQGDFYAMCKAAMDHAREGRALTPLDYKFFFFPWHRDSKCYLDPEDVAIPEALNAYFQRLWQKHGVKLSDGQKAWYAKMVVTQRDQMKQEYPSFPEEAFEAAIEGAYYSYEMARAREEGRITRVPYESGLAVNTFWDLGLDDQTVIWLHQAHGGQNRFIECHHKRGEGLQYYADYLKEKGYIFGEHYLPHDGAITNIQTNKTCQRTLEGWGIRPIRIVQRPKDGVAVADQIQQCRNIFSTCWFDEVMCAGTPDEPSGIEALDAYRKQWDEKLVTFKNRPLHNWASDFADAFRTFGVGWKGTMLRRSKPLEYPDAGAYV